MNSLLTITEKDTSYSRKLAIAYRIYPSISKIPPIYPDNKYKLSELCLKSFSNALKGIDYHLWVILDNCPPEYNELFYKYFDETRVDLISTPGIGNAATFGKQLEILTEQDFSEFIYFAEDDYFYLQNAFIEMLEFMNSRSDVHYISPFDHLDYYTLDFHKYKKALTFFNERHWQTAATTCMTFMTKKSILKQDYSVFCSYTKKNYDTSLWMSLTKYNIFNPIFYTKTVLNERQFLKIIIKCWYHNCIKILFGKKRFLWTPIPSLSTHMDSLCMAPIINWEEEFEKNN
jgi:hypothetical protein